MIIKRLRYLAFTTCALAVLISARLGAQNLVDQWFLVKTGPAATEALWA
jgi:hypothetical protein